ncbi:hypothetical protein BJ878DRAFT_180416 [Calycina marina]|uniref:Uncharacterized protein n=1 Tax=Calycina marina TaxID=1763456 RepID=A0A9P7YYV4_9HELO|nr:hypothetical protein BJ878DRAFT_180416 [Calycina marina]
MRREGMICWICLVVVGTYKAFIPIGTHNLSSVAFVSDAIKIVFFCLFFFCHVWAVWVGLRHWWVDTRSLWTKLSW